MKTLISISYARFADRKSPFSAAASAVVVLTVAICSLCDAVLLCHPFLSVLISAAEIDSKTSHPEARIRIVIPSLVEVENKLKWMIELSPDPQLQKQWKKLKNDMLDAFTDGVDEKRPASVEIVFAADGPSYDYRIPISDLTGERNGFLQGLRGRSYKVHMLGDGRYEILEKGQKPASLLFDGSYAWIATGGRAAPTKPQMSTSDLMPLLALKKDIVVEIKNDAEGIPLRRANYKAFQTYREGRSRIRRNESTNAFELRKVLQKAMLNGAGCYLVEAEQLLVNWTINSATPRRFGRGEVLLTALAGTDLCRLIEKCATKPSYFANLTMHENVLAVSRICIPLNAISIDHLKDFSKSLRAILETEIKARSAQTDGQREAWMHTMNVFIDMLEEGTELRTVDAFAELFSSASHSNILLCGVRAANGKKADEIVKTVQSLRSGWQAKLDVHKHASVRIHELTLGKQDLAAFQTVFDDQSVFYVGTGENVVWVAAGADSLRYLKIAIEQATQPTSEKISPVVASYTIKVGKLITLFEAIYKQALSRNTPLTQEQKQTRKDIDKYLRLAHEALSGCDSLIEGELQRIDNRIEGSMELNECVLRLIGSILADTVKELE